MGHVKPFVKARRGAERCLGYFVWVDQLCKSREKVKYGEDRTAAKYVKYFVDMRNCDLWDLSDLVQFLVVDGDSDAARFFWDAYQGAQPKEVKCWMRPAAM